MCSTKKFFMRKKLVTYAIAQLLTRSILVAYGIKVGTITAHQYSVSYGL